LGGAACKEKYFGERLRWKAQLKFFAFMQHVHAACSAMILLPMVFRLQPDRRARRFVTGSGRDTLK
jgi:hypothetical protein